jgi:methyl-accepting chemotaxis protein
MIFKTKDAYAIYKGIDGGDKMNFLNKFKIGAKLIILITFMLVGIFVVGGVGTYYNNKASRSLTDIYMESLIPVQLLNDTRVQSRGNYASMLKLLLVTSNSEQEKILEEIKSRQTLIQSNLADFEHTSLDQYEQMNYDTLEDKIAEWDKYLQQLINLVTEGKKEEALKVYMASGEQVFENMQSTIRDLSVYNAEDAANDYSDSKKDTETAMILLIIIALVVSTVAVILSLFIARSITSPIKKLIGFINNISNLNLVHDAAFEDLKKHKDEVGTIINATGEMRAVLRSIVEQIINISNSLAANSEELTASTDENTKTVNQVVMAINEIAGGNSAQAEMVNKVSATILHIGESIEEVNKTTNQSADNAAQSLEIISKGERAIDRVAEGMRDNIKVSAEVSHSISELSESIGKVGNITQVIDSIATQTNLLALNAAIEAARAGEAGKGFSVVAEEIRKLAEGSAAAAKEITNIIKDTVGKNAAAAENIEKAKKITSEQEKAVDVTREAFEDIKVSAKDIAQRTKNAADMLSKIDAASREISHQTQDMAAIAEESAASSEEISASSEEQLTSIEMIAKAAGHLSEMAMELNDEISKFTI